ncbi:MAG: hypothetical protein KDA63_02560, partial [Planctomycetales bacterium]|nr:hypothetical protein [Planctomycetales bacterium]
GNPLSGAHNLIEDGSGGLNDTITGDPLLGPLADNGGPTMTHALLPGSPAIDAGDPAFAAPPYLDQRGYYRVVDGDGDMTARIDMGAFEYASVPPLAGDGNLDQAVDGLDYLLWAEHFGDDPTLDPPGAPLNGDYNDDGVVDGLDYIVWAENFEASVPLSLASGAERSAAGPVAVSAGASGRTARVDAAIATEYGRDTTAARADEWRLSLAIDALMKKRREVADA